MKSIIETGKSVSSAYIIQTPKGATDVFLSCETDEEARAKYGNSKTRILSFKHKAVSFYQTINPTIIVRKK